MEDWFSITSGDLPDSPALLVYPQRVKHNIDLLISSIDNIARLRPHVKTHKCRQAAEFCLDAGITKFKCATIAEAEVLAMAGAPDVLLAYQPVGPKVTRFINLIKSYSETKFSCLIDNFVTAQSLDNQARATEVNVPVYIDLNVGMNRSGILPEKAFELCLKIKSLTGLKLEGLHLYDGHIHDEDLKLRNAKVNSAFADVEELISLLNNSGFTPIIVAGGTPTFPAYAAMPAVECSPGTFIYWDGGYSQAFTEQPYLCAALILTRVVSLPDETKICVDLGHKSVASESPLEKRVSFLNAPELKVVGHSEEHMVLDAGKGHSYRPGDVLYALPHHICPTVALYEKADIVVDNRISGEWKTLARDRKINY